MLWSQFTETPVIDGLARYMTQQSADSMLTGMQAMSVTELQTLTMAATETDGITKDNIRVTATTDSPWNCFTVLVLDRDINPESLQHVRDAQAAGKPAILTIERTGAVARRRQALRDFATMPGKDRDEYPPAMFLEGGERASVRYIDPSDNRSAGSIMGKRLASYPNGCRVQFIP